VITHPDTARLNKAEELLRAGRTFFGNEETVGITPELGYAVAAPTLRAALDAASLATPKQTRQLTDKELDDMVHGVARVIWTVGGRHFTPEDLSNLNDALCDFLKAYDASQGRAD
jgi:hypothetical protein